ncbi:Aminotran 1 2 domain-containing protein [Citrus sinensis]|nr:Aminotran 1 2 domain-containing protein [Citrus sinensis]
MVIANEVYGHLAFGNTPFVSMGVFGSIVPLLTLGSISKRGIVPGLRLGWLVTSDPNGILQDSGIVDSIKIFLNISSDPATFIQGAVPQILEKTEEEFFSKIIDILRETADKCCDRLKEIPCITCPKKPEGSMFVMQVLKRFLLTNPLILEITGITVGLKDWLRITFAVEPSALENGLGRMKAFYDRHAEKQ